MPHLVTGGAATHCGLTSPNRNRPTTTARTHSSVLVGALVDLVLLDLRREEGPKVTQPHRTWLWAPEPAFLCAAYSAVG